MTSEFDLVYHKNGTNSNSVKFQDHATETLNKWELLLSDVINVWHENE